MKKLLIFISLFIPLTQVFAINPADWYNKLPDNFKSECYEYYNKIDKSEVRDNNNTGEKYKTYKINIDKTDDLVVTQFWYIIPYKYYSGSKNFYNYNSNLQINDKFLLDYNKKTYIEIKPNTQNEILLSFNDILQKESFNMLFHYYPYYDHFTEYYISKDQINWDIIERKDIENFSFKFLKIKFIPKSKQNFLKNIKIYELNFPKKSNTILVKSHYNENIEFYSNFNCKVKDFNTKAKNYDLFTINNRTKSIKVLMDKNPKYNVYSKKDNDNDWVEDNIDNCKYRYNPNQADKNWDWIWDICSDDDKDWKIWYYDNCINIYNPDQKDINRNWIWDVCEFDKDKDSIYDSQDNCINISNRDQKDTDKDWIWDLCDNCKLYNPRQLDTDNNWIWDTCDKEEKYVKENDKDNDRIIDSKDNCKNIANKNQNDSDEDWIGDSCDNCKNIQNNDQLYFNKNWVWDICEDSDNDGIEWINDNCINTSNANQKDSDNDGIWDVCEDNDKDMIIAINDNCPFKHNPKQADIDNDGIWDKCDKDDNRFIESNSTFFIILLLIVSIIFWFWIYKMIKKLNKN